MEEKAESSKYYCAKCDKRFKASAKSSAKPLHCPLCGAELERFQAAAKRSPSPETRNPLLRDKRLVAISALVTIVLLIAGYSFIAWYRSSEATNSDSIADRANVDESNTDATNVGETDSPEFGVSDSARDPEPSVLTPSVASFLEQEYVYRFEMTAQSPEERYEWAGHVAVATLPDRPIRVATGVAIPNRWIIVPLNLVENAEAIEVIHEGTKYDAEVRKKLEKLGWATLQIDRREKFPSPLADREDRLTRNAQDLSVVYLNESGATEVISGLSVTGGMDGHQYQIKSLPQAAMGGVVVHNSGRLAGIVTSINAQRSVLMPWSKIADGWGSGGGAGIFDYESPVSADLIGTPEGYGNQLVQVAVLPASSTTRRVTSPLLFQSRIDPVQLSNQLSRPVRGLGATSFRNSSQTDFRLERATTGLLVVEPTSSRRPAKPQLLPYGIGQPINLTVMPISSGGAKRWTAEERVRVDYGRGTGIDHPDGADQRGFTSCSGTCSYVVIQESGNRIDLKRTVERANDQGSPVQISHTGTEKVLLDLESGFVRERVFAGELVQTITGRLPKAVKIHYELKLMRQSDAKEVTRYWQ